VTVVGPEAERVPALDPTEPVGVLPRGALGPRVGVDVSPATPKLGQTHGWPGLLQGTELSEHTGKCQRRNRVARNLGAAKGRVGREVAEAEVVDH